MIFVIERTDELEYDENTACVVRASNEKKARNLAAKTHACEDPTVWLDPAKSRCRVLQDKGRKEIILIKHIAG